MTITRFNFNKTIPLFFWLIIATNFSSCNSQSPDIEQRVDELLIQMTLEEKIGQMIIVGLDGYKIDYNTRSMIENYHVGGFILFRDNVESSEQLLSLINSLKETNFINKLKRIIKNKKKKKKKKKRKRKKRKKKKKKEKKRKKKKLYFIL